MTKTIKAVYENGVLRPVEQLEGLLEHQTVKLTVETETKSSTTHSHPLADYAGILTHDEADNMIQVIENEFERVDLNEWKA